MLTRLPVAALTLIAASPALAHPGHDHGATVGGSLHHLLWLAVPAAAALAAFALRGPIAQAIKNRRK